MTSDDSQARNMTSDDSQARDMTSIASQTRNTTSVTSQTRNMTAVAFEARNQAPADTFCYARFTDVMCNRQANFVEKLREMRPTVELCYMTLLCFKSDLERQRVTSKDRDNLLQEINECCREVLPNILANNTLNIMSPERQAIRQIKDELAVLGNHIEDIKEEDFSRLDQIIIGIVAVTCENMREFMRWVDQKTERRWWLAETIRFCQLFLKLATFVSAVVSVAFRPDPPNEQIAPIVTLAFTIFQGLIDLLEQFFVKKISPKQIKLSLVSPLVSTAQARPSDQLRVGAQR